MENQITVYEVAAFTNQVSAGSPTGVVLDASSLTSDQMQHIAKAVGYSHTAFIIELDQDDCDIRIRFFTPMQEIKNCGHGTIAAHVLRTMHNSSSGHEFVKQHVLSGIQEVEICHQGEIITAHFKQREIYFYDVEQLVADELMSALNITKADLNIRCPIMLASPGSNRFMVGLNNLATLNSVSPHFEKLMDVCDQVDSIGCFVFTVETLTTSAEATGRMFAPVIGVYEDIVNGNSSGCLGAYLLRLDHINMTGPELNLTVRQGHLLKRPGTVLVTAKWVEDQIETTIGGTAVVSSQRQISLAPAEHE